MAKKNYGYGHADENGNIVYAPNMLIDSVTDDDGNTRQVQMFNAPAEKYAEHGEYPVVYTDRPAEQDGGYWQPVWATADGQTVQGWVFVEFQQEVTGND